MRNVVQFLRRGEDQEVSDREGDHEDLHGEHRQNVEASQQNTSPRFCFRTWLEGAASNEVIQAARWFRQMWHGISRAALQASRFTLRSCWAYLSTYPGHTVLLGLLLFSLLVLSITGSRLHDDLVNSRLLDRTVDALGSASQYDRRFSERNLQRLGTREFLRVGGPKWIQSTGVRAVLLAAREAGLSIEHQAVLLATAEVESGFNPLARASTTTACGLFQFVRATGRQFGLNQATCFDPVMNARSGVVHYVTNYQKTVESQVSDLRGPEKVLKMFELSYYLHHDGPSAKTVSNDVKATVLTATPYLFRAYEILQQEQEVRKQEPTFQDRVAEELDGVKSGVQNLLVPLTGIAPTEEVRPVDSAATSP